MGETLTRASLEAAVMGGAVLAAGAGGDAWRRRSRLAGELALGYGRVTMVRLEELPPTALIMTVSQVGAPSASHDAVRPRDLVRAAEMLLEATLEPVMGVMSSEATTVNGWIQAAVLGLAVVDASGDGRGHPTVEMGCLGFRDEPIVQTAAGGMDQQYLEVVSRGSVLNTSKVLRATAAEAGGIIGAARMPLQASVIQERAAVGALSFQIDLGRLLLDDVSAEVKLDRLLAFGGGRVLARGPVQRIQLTSQSAFDDGRAEVESADGVVELRIWNEYMAAISHGRVVSRFPDLIVTLDPRTMMPLATHELQEGMDVLVIAMDEDRLPLGRGVRVPAHLQEVWTRIGLESGGD